jgi:hypothetical protein
MPWCDACSRYLTPNALATDGSCPSCKRVVAEPARAERAPWHFWLLVGSAGLYLGWRAVQGVAWLVQHA